MGRLVKPLPNISSTALLTLEENFTENWGKYWRYVLKLIRQRFPRQNGLAEDLLMEAGYRMWLAWRRRGGKGINFLPYLITVTSRTIQDWRRRQIDGVTILPLNDFLEETSLIAEDVIGAIDPYSPIMSLYNSLPQDSQYLIQLLMEGYSHGEIAIQVGNSKEGVSARVRQIRNHFQKQVATHIQLD